jgi:hypothetical protein
MKRIIFTLLIICGIAFKGFSQKISFKLNTEDKTAFGYESLMYLQLFNSQGQRIQEEIDVEPADGFEIDFSKVEYFLMTEEKSRRTLRISLKRKSDGNHEILYHEVKTSQPTMWHVVPGAAPAHNAN